MYGEQDFSEPSAPTPDLAPRVTRALAAFVDWSLGFVFSMIAVLAMLGWGVGALVRLAASGGAGALDRHQLSSSPWFPVLVGSAIALVALGLYQCASLAFRGQTLGKHLFRIQIVDDCGAPAGFFRALLLRVWVFGLVMGVLEVLLGRAIGAIGLVLALANIIPIFTARRRCLHDYFAGTRVMEARASPFGAVPALVIAVAAASVLGVLAVRAGAGTSVAELQRIIDDPSALQSLTGGTRLLPGPAVTGPAQSATVRETNYIAPKATQRIYRWVDDTGAMNFAEDLSEVPKKHRARAVLVE